ncbi:hypothetical protein M404DRAFT_25659 [Pisolithus tinctorius Marx 270]|uniref:Uncharacterized protein n=1 Tax=Pisolithus tinctorius Marx 270 TaxID=870435 RepID=A0A0C3J7L2_PISTI|nr:hypothetical protein M404DRAFT_25659 [Pisolithus tinctorius Marx 270]
MSKSRLITATDNNDEGWVIIDWTQLPDDDIRYDTNNEEEVMKAKAKERKRQKAAEQAWWEEQAQLEAKRAAREKAEAKRTVQEAEEQRACEEEERCRAEEEKEAKHKCKAEARKSSEAGANGNETSEVRKVVMDHGCTCCTWANIVCEFIIDGNKKHITCVRCNLSKGKCRWPGDGKDAEASPKARRADKGKKQKAEEENAKAGPSNQKWARTSASGSRMKEAGAARYSGLENKLERLIEAAGLIANNLASLFKLHKTMVENLGCIADALKLILDKSYSSGMAVSPSDLGLSELDSDELCEEAEWLKNHGKDEEEESEGEDESMAKAE